MVSPHLTDRTLRVPREEARSIAVFRALQLGDLLCTVPALRALRSAYPQARITLIGLPWAATLIERYPDLLDAHLTFPGYPGLPEQPWNIEHVAQFVGDVRALGLDLLLQMQGDGSVVNPLMATLGARYVAGFARAESWRPDDTLFLDYPEQGTEVDRMLALPRHLGAHADPALDSPVATGEATGARALLAMHGVRGGYAALHPDARAKTRRWPTRHFAAIGDTLAARGLAIVVTGSHDEAPVVRATIEAMRAPATNLAGATSLGVLGALLRDAHVLVCNDTGVSHLAAATGTASVVVFSGSDPDRWAPHDADRHRVVHGPRLGVARFEPASTEEVRSALDALSIGVLDAA